MVRVPSTTGSRSCSQRCPSGTSTCWPRTRADIPIATTRVPRASATRRNLSGRSRSMPIRTPCASTPRSPPSVGRFAPLTARVGAPDGSGDGCGRAPVHPGLGTIARRPVRGGRDAHPSDLPAPPVRWRRGAYMTRPTCSASSTGCRRRRRREEHRCLPMDPKRRHGERPSPGRADEAVRQE